MGVGRCSLTLVTLGQWAALRLQGKFLLHGRKKEQRLHMDVEAGVRLGCKQCADGAAAPPPVVTAGSSCLGGLN